MEKTLTERSLALCVDCGQSYEGAHDCRAPREVKMSRFEEIYFRLLRGRVILRRAKEQR